MDTNNGIPNQGDWRGQLHPVLRQKVVNRITESLKMHSPVSGQEELHELQNLAQRFEDKNFTAATSQADYVRKIRMRMLAWEIKCQGTIVNNITSSLDMLTLETESLGTIVNNITSSLDMLTLETESQGTMANKETESKGTMANKETESQGTKANKETESQGTKANKETESQGTLANKESESQGTMANKETESHGTMANNITSSLDMETESQGSMANNMTSNQVAPINKPLDPANGRPDQGDWRGKLQPGTHERNVNKLLDTLKRHIPFPGQEGLRPLRKLARRFEDRIFTAATSESDYATKIFLKSIKIETKLQSGSLASNMTRNQIDPSNKPLDPDLANGRLNQGDWRGTLQPGARERIVNIIMDTLKKQLPIVSGQEGSNEFGKIVQSFEEGIFTAATNKTDYGRQICLKTHALITKCQDPEMIIIALKLAQLMK